MFSILKKGLWFLPIKFLKKGTVNFVIKSINTLYIEKCCLICLRNKTALWLLLFFQFLPLTGKNWWISWKQEKWTNEKYSVHKYIVIHVLGSASRVSFFYILYALCFQTSQFCYIWLFFIPFVKNFSSLWSYIFNLIF